MPKIGKHKKLCYIECTYWTCKFQAVKFVVNPAAELTKTCEKSCHDKVKGILNLAGHVGMNAPKWCQRRRKNGGMDK